MKIKCYLEDGRYMDYECDACSLEEETPGIIYMMDDRQRLIGTININCMAAIEIEYGEEVLVS